MPTRAPRFLPALALLSLVCILVGCGNGGSVPAVTTPTTIAPVAAFSFAPAAPTTGQSVTFTDASSNIPTSWSWNFGDSSTSAAQNPTHSYSSAGTFTVTLTAANSAGSNSASHSVTVTAATTTLTYPIVQSGQVACFNTTVSITCPTSGQTYYGQDAQFSKDNTFRYTLSADSKTVADNVTGLTWMRSPNMTLTAPVKTDRMVFTAFSTWVASVNAAKWGGFNDWRVPTLKELYSLYDAVGVDPSNYSGTDTSVLTPFINTGYFLFAYGNTSLGERLIDQQYASTTTFILNPSESGYQKDFGVNFSDGRIKGYDETDVLSNTLKTYYVQLVRGPATYGSNSFVNNGDGTITDKSTGLMWSQSDNGSALLWPNALAWVQSMNSASYLGHNDWRMPNIKELQTIVDYNNAPDYNGLPAIDTTYFRCTAILNEAGVTDYPYYWSSTTHQGYSTTGPSGGSADYIAFGRALGWPSTQTKWVDVHGAGAQRSDSTVAPPYSYATVYSTVLGGVTYTGYSFGPQGDAIRGLNYVRLVRNTP